MPFLLFGASQREGYGPNLRIFLIKNVFQCKYLRKFVWKMNFDNYESDQREYLLSGTAECGLSSRCQRLNPIILDWGPGNQILFEMKNGIAVLVSERHCFLSDFAKKCWWAAKAIACPVRSFVMFHGGWWTFVLQMSQTSRFIKHPNTIKI
jgi:hypothetical protein